MKRWLWSCFFLTMVTRWWLYVIIFFQKVKDNPGKVCGCISVYLKVGLVVRIFSEGQLHGPTKVFCCLFL